MSDNPYENYYQGMNNTPPDNPVDMSENSQQKPSDNDFEYNEWESVPEPEHEQVPMNPYNQPVLINEQENIPQVYNEIPASENVPVSYEWYGDSSPVVDMPYDYRTPEVQNPDYSNSRKTKEKARMPVALLLLICMLVSSVFGGGSAFIVNYLGNKSRNASSSDSGLTVNQVAPDSGDGNYSTAGELSTVEIVDKSADSVVEIITESVTTGVFSQQYIQSGAGSGVIIDSEGYIVTNHHVIEGARKISVTLRNGETYSAELIGSDAKEDLALLKIEAENLTAAVMGDSDTLKVGQRTIAIGNPLGQLGGTVTEGIISALDRELVVDGQTMNLLQTDTAINPGNSGGGMFDGKGNLIGVVVAKSSGSEVEGLGFAIPVNDALTVISDLMEYGYVRGRVDIGIEFLDVASEAEAWLYGLSETGCYVYEVERYTNAEDAGFKRGDLVTKVDGNDVFSSDDIEKILDKKTVGDVVEFTVKRDGRVGKLSLELEEDTPDTFADSENELDNLIPWYNFG